MALIGNRSSLLKSPGRFLAGGPVCVMRSAFNTHGMQRNAYQSYNAKSATPDGHLSPSAWVLPNTAGGMSSHNVTVLGFSPTGFAVGGVTADGESGLTFTVADAAGQLISSGEGSASFLLSTNTPLLTASLAAVGSASFTLSGATTTLTALGDAAGSATFSVTPTASILPASDASPLRTATATLSFSGTLTSYALGVMSGSTVTGGAMTEASIIAAMNASPPAVNIKQVNSVAVTGDGQLGTEWGPA
jgi:hypothetical protein